MTIAADPHTIRSVEQLESLFGAVGEASIRKETAFVHPHYRAMIEASPFAMLATTGPDGLDASPRGDAPGFVQVQEEHTLLLPERRGNNRVDSLRNILHDPRVALLFLIPGVGETLRVNGRASITTAPDVLARFTVQGQLPKCVVVSRVESVFFQCARAIQRSGLWQPPAPDARTKVPSPGAILQALTNAAVDGETYDRELPARQRATLY
ncbi:MAG: pyridoxamine 5'-phosphate oxidase family protein [Polaromonas sp.]|uniref:pyridoxamine 5'-phosphate oxidase family protein n=1 Tax=Polaromonas sp. TaxID=1869339 RepID=UPI0018420371|nr:pyridoxamine 5'-phosphate oxidase family protein [Polaromonas sp.]MBA3593880.1 pyridoxamine 5'-phosphate oxidase family protein [Polaromonas sp.]